MAGNAKHAEDMRMLAGEWVKGTETVKSWCPDIEEQAAVQVEKVAALPWVAHVAVMPDAHWGMGCTVGTVIGMRDALSPASVGVDVGCLVGETRVPLLNGMQATLAELTSRSEPFWIYSVDADGRIAPGRAMSRMTRKQAPLVRVVVSGGEEIVCTPDHLFMLGDGSYREAKDLWSNASLMPFYRRWQTRDGYESVSTGHGSTRQTHVLVWEALNGPVPPGHVVHHENHANFDNRPENFKLMTAEAHSSHHRKTGHSFKNADPEFQEKRMAGIKRRWADPLKRAQGVAVGTANIVKYMEEQPEHYKAAVAGNGQRGAEYLIAYAKSAKGRKNSREIGKTFGFGKSNHKVLSVTPLDYVADVYCLQVEEHHNFALAAGVFVHNCGMTAARLPFKAGDLPDNLAALRHSFERSVPVGFNQHAEPAWAAWGDAHEGAKVTDLMQRASGLRRPTAHGTLEKAARQIGTLGGGNHFIELSLDEADGVWLVLHSGSRNIGKELAEFHIGVAKKLIHNAELPDKDLAVFLAGTPEMDAYRHDLTWAQEFAALNREAMLTLLLKDIGYAIPGHHRYDVAVIRCHHNYVAEETHFGEQLFVTRKGAISALPGQPGIIPGSVGSSTYIVRGLGNANSMNSASHGAGRRMGRGAAKRTFTVADVLTQTAGVECRKDAEMIDELPGAYKDIETVMNNQKDLVEITHTLRAVLCVKG